MNVHVFNAFRQECSPLLSLLYKSASTSLGLSAKSNPFLTSNVLIISAPQTTTSLERPILTPYTGSMLLAPSHQRVSECIVPARRRRHFQRLEVLEVLEGSPLVSGGAMWWWGRGQIERGWWRSSTKALMPTAGYQTKMPSRRFGSS